VSVNVYRTCSEEETINLGRDIAEKLSRPAVVLLAGDLGAGKTTLAKGIVEGLGVAQRDEVLSPTFTLIHEYGNDVYHIDLYRLDTAQQVTRLGIDELIQRNSVVLIEWGERFPQLWPDDHIEIRIEAKNDERRLSVIGLR
jgi:tRNA threonylcarbamoyladenosine biosynthesis protein TsaE